jgi:hypothetical protein
MSRSLIALAMVLAAAPLAAASQDANAGSKTKEITLHGCVMPGTDKDTYVMTQVMEMPGAGGATMPEVAHGRRVLFWLHDDDDVKKHAGQMVMVRGDLRDLEESEIELKAGSQKEGGLVVEFEGPGTDVRASNDTVGAAVGTAGRTVPEKDDIPTYLAHIDVKEVQVMGACK